MSITITEGDILNQDVDVIINPWNRNILPWWLLLPQGVSGAIKRRGGLKPFNELRRTGILPLGGAVMTSAGKLKYRAIIHVAGIGLNWCSSEKSVRLSVQNALKICIDQQFNSVAFPLIGAGTGGGSPKQIEGFIIDEIEKSQYQGRAVIVKFSKT
jgi:O-acetyl-ADP-ribose deacetylase (regulator of RNase III)